MKRINHLIPQIADMDNLRLAFWKAKKGKNYAKNVLKFAENLEDNLLTLQEQILSGNIDVGKYTYFTIFEPKERKICASAFDEQVLHHAMMNICHPYFEKAHIYDSYASRKEKGTHKAIERAKFFTKKYAYFLKLDVRKFFDSVHHSVIKTQLARIFKDEKLLLLFDKIIDSYESEVSLSPRLVSLPNGATPNEAVLLPQSLDNTSTSLPSMVWSLSGVEMPRPYARGIPIGNLTSQYFANHYLCSLDHYIKEYLQIKSYVRYMDDMVLWHEDKQVLKNAFLQIQEYVQSGLKCSLKPKILASTKRGLPFLGYLIFPYQIRLLQKSKQRFIKKWKTIDKNYHNGKWNESLCQRKFLPLLAFILQADTKNFRKKLSLPPKG